MALFEGTAPHRTEQSFGASGRGPSGQSDAVVAEVLDRVGADEPTRN